MKTHRPIPHAPFDREHPLCDVVAKLFLEMREGFDLLRLVLAEEANISDAGSRLIETCTCIPRLRGKG
jgi:hypothetical protein